MRMNRKSIKYYDWEETRSEQVSPMTSEKWFLTPRNVSQIDLSALKKEVKLKAPKQASSTARGRSRVSA